MERNQSKVRNDINDFQKEVLVRLTKIETKLDNYKDIESTSQRALNFAEDNKKDIEKIQNQITWLVRTITGTILGFIVSVLSMLIKHHF